MLCALSDARFCFGFFLVAGSTRRKYKLLYIVNVRAGGGTLLYGADFCTLKGL